MPNLPMHIYLAHQVAEQLDWGYVRDYTGSYYLGSTAPDIRAMTRWPRERTHFAPLSVTRVGTGLQRMLEQHPELAHHRGTSPATLAFVLGYISHLIADECWITTMFRPHFGDGSMITSTAVEAHIWDRALQLDMDQAAWQQMDGFKPHVEALATAEQGVEVTFLPPETLQEWRGWVCRFMGWDFSWERLKRALNRMYRDDDEVQQEVDRFLLEIPRSLERIYEKIPPEKLDAYQQRVIDETVAQLRYYLG